MSETIDRFIPTADVRERHEIVVRSPAELVFDVAERFELDSIPIVRGIFWLRSKLLGARYERLHEGLVQETLQMGWAKLSYAPGRELVMGAVTQPWLGVVEFRAIAPDNFAVFNQPDQVKIVWTLEAEPLSPELTCFRTETRAVCTDEGSRKKFKAYWRKFWIGIVMIRRLTLPAVRKKAERLYRVRVTESTAA